jgi:hypothetical protein
MRPFFWVCFMSYITSRLVYIFMPLVIIIAGGVFYSEKMVTASINKNPVIVVLVMSFVAVIVGIVIQKQTSREKNTLDFEEKYKHDKDIIRCFNVAIDVCSSKTGSEIKALAADTKDSNYQSISALLNEWERAANAIHHNLYDEPMLYKVHGSLVIYLWTRLQPFIETRQRVNPRFFANFTRLAVKWQIRRAKEDTYKQTLQMAQHLNELHQASSHLINAQKSNDDGVNGRIAIHKSIENLERHHKKYETVTRL